MAMAASTLSASSWIAATCPAAAAACELSSHGRTAARPALLRASSHRWSGVQLKSIQRHHGARSSLSNAQTIAGGARAGVEYVDAEEAKQLVAEEGYSIIDIRDVSQYNRAHIPKSLHVPLFIDNEDADPGTLLKKFAHNSFAGAFYGVAFTKQNDAFLPTVEKQFKKDDKLLIVCQEGLRSGTAADMLEQAGYQNVAYLVNGLQKVKPGLFDKEGPKELEEAGKAGLVTIQGQFSAVLGTLLVLAYLYLQFFPDQAAEIFFKN